MALELTNDQYENLVAKSTKPVVIDVYATWCGPCKQLAPNFDAVSHDLGTTHNFFKVNVDNERELAAKFGISSIPTILFIKDGTLVATEMGYMSKETLKEKITQHLG